ncbi:MAG: mechanosensitive ion channel family protein [Hyphomicrobiales bacterium]|nr:mechanosensitive ion channel family protein [Hyphomicrobiales bacterium]
MGEITAFLNQLWNEGVFGASMAELSVGLGIFVTVVIFRGMLARIVMYIMRRAGKKIQADSLERIANAMHEPLRFLFPVIVLFLFKEILVLPGPVNAFTEQLLRSLFVVGVFWFVYGLVDFLIDLVRDISRSGISEEVDHWLCRSLRIFVVLVAGATILEIWGVAIAPILAGLGIGGVAVALGAQDLFKNLIGGAAILVEKRFGIGDWIKVEGVVEGTVERIGYRSTLVRKFDLAPAYVPNHQLSDTGVVNYSAMLKRRIYWKIGLSYSSSIAQLREVRDGIEAYIASSDAFESPDKVSMFVRIDNFSDSSIDILVYCFTKTTKWGEWLEIKEALMYHIKDLVEGAGTSFAFPSRSIYVESLPHGTPAKFESPLQPKVAP